LKSKGHRSRLLRTKM